MSPGHNWGSPHDPNQCSGGKYIMSASAVDGSDSNNFKFSSCSKASILSVLKAKSHCFTGRCRNVLYLVIRVSDCRNVSSTESFVWQRIS